MGSAADVFEDYSPLQIGASGTWNGRPFVVIGRLQWRTAQASWNEWHVLLEDGAGSTSAGAAPATASNAWLSEDNGRYVMAVDQRVPGDVTDAADPPRLREALLGWKAGQSTTIGGQAWSVASVVTARIAAAQGELSQVPAIDEPVAVVDLRNARGQVATLSAGQRHVGWSFGASVALDALALQGLRDASVGAATTRGVTCPSCGTALSITLDATKSIACHQCKAIVDISHGVGGDLSYRKQASAGVLGDPLIPLGSTGEMAFDGAKATWQVVGYQVRQQLDSDDFEPPWTEYLLYSRSVGFAFLVASSEGWSWAVPLTGAPTARGSTATWKDRNYTKRWEYVSKTTYVLGEFYWKLEREQLTKHVDYASGPRRLSHEQQGEEVTWSEGATVPASVVTKAFGLEAASVPADAKPLAAANSIRPGVIIAVIVVVILLFVMMRACSGDRCDDVRSAYGASSVEYQQCLARSRSSSSSRSSGGSWGGGGSSSGGHK